MSYTFELLTAPFPAGEPVLGLATVAGTVLLAGFLRGFIGFGAALVMMPVLSLVFGPRAAVPIASLTALPAVFQLLPQAVRFAERPIVVPIALATCTAAPFGSWILASVDPRMTKIAISALVLAMTAMLHGGWRLAARPRLGVLLGAGAVAGLVQGVAGVGGPPVVAIALSRPGSPAQQRANVLGAITAISFSSLLPLWYFGLFTRNVILASVLLVPLYSGATWLGARFFTRRGHHHYHRVALATLAVIGLVTFGFALRDYLRG